MSTSRDTFQDGKSYISVKFQQGVPAVDNELNEAQKIREVATVEAASAAMSGYRSTVATGLRYGFAAENDWKAYAIGTPDIILTAGALLVDGYRVQADTDQSLMSAGLSFPVVGGSDIYGYIAVDLTVSVITGLDDPIILTPGVGETTQRLKLGVSYVKGESTSDFEAAFASLPVLPPVGSPPARIWKDNTARILICRYVRPAGSTNITSDMLVDLRQAPPGEHLAQRMFAKTLRASNTDPLEGNGSADGMIAWNLDNETLQIGILNPAPSFAAGLLGRSQGSPDVYVGRNNGITWAQNGAGNANGTPITPDWSNGWLIGLGQALGYKSAGTALIANAARLTKKTLNDVPRANVIDIVPAVAGTPALLVQTLAVDNIDNFTGDPGSFIVCTRVGNDLIWYNGQVMRGEADNTTFMELGAEPSIYNAVVGFGGHLTQTDAVERALSFIATGAGTGTLGTQRTVRVHAKHGSYLFARTIKKYGTVAEGAALPDFALTNNSIELTGDGPEVTKLIFSNTEAATRSASDVAVCSIIAGRIKIDGLAFDQIETSTFRGSYVLYLEGAAVELTNCHFTGPVYIKSNRITIRDCVFNGMSNSYQMFPAAAANTLVAQHLYCILQGASLTDAIWRITDNMFKAQMATGANACVVLNCFTSQKLRCKFDNNTFNYSSTATCAAVHVEGDTGDITICDNRFFGANGVGKPGYDTSAGQVVPFNGGNYNGTPVVAGGAATLVTTCSYISVTRGRARDSSLRVVGNYFDFSKVADGATARFVVWGGMLCMFNYSSLNSSPSCVYANIVYENNMHDMYLSGNGQWAPAAANPQPWIAGFYLAPTWGDSSANIGITNVVIDGIALRNNKFDVGGHDSVGFVPVKTWRSIASGDLNGAMVGLMGDTSCLLGVSLKNAMLGVHNFTGRIASNIVVENNCISQRQASGSFGPVYAQITCTRAAHPFYALRCVVLDAGEWSTSRPIAGETVDPFNPALGGQIIASPVINNNRFELPFYTQNPASSVDAAAILLSGVFGATMTGNYVFEYIDVGAANGMFGIKMLGCAQALAVGNVIKADTGIASDVNSSHCSAGGNMLRGCSVTVALVANKMIGVFDDATPTDNFT